SRTLNAFTSLDDFCVRVGILKCCPPRPPHESPRAERFVLSVITIYLPPAQSAAGIHNLPTRATKDFLHSRGRRLNDHTAAQPALTQLCGSGKARDQNATPTGRLGSIGIRITAVVGKIMTPVDRHCY